MNENLFIVVVDDDPAVGKALKRLLRSLQMEVRTHASVEEFLLETDPQEPDCLILDIRMPGLTGFELHARLQSLGRRIPTVFITAHDEELREAVGEEPQILHKPFGEKALLTAIRRAVGPSS
jgi:FixJ family two-component response regulator